MTRMSSAHNSSSQQGVDGSRRRCPSSGGLTRGARIAGETLQSAHSEVRVREVSAGQPFGADAR